MNKRPTSNQPSSFLQKTYDMLEDESTSELISWVPSGDGFCIVNPPEFAEQILPRFFKHNNLASFVRQLNMYGFHKNRSTGEQQIFKHPLFIRGREDLLKDIQRKTAENNMQLVPASSIGQNELTPLLKKLYQLYTRSEANDARIKNLEGTIKTLTMQNKTLISQLWETRQRTQRIENVLLLIAGYLRDTRQDIPGHIVRDSLLSITHQPLEEEKFDDMLSAPPVVEEENEDEVLPQLDISLQGEDDFDLLFD